MRLKFTKMHELGNDFIVFDATREPLALSREQLRRIADRHFGGGNLSILWEGAGRPVEMTGPAVTVFEGEIEI